jgi:hypothetical protein
MVNFEGRAGRDPSPQQAAADCQIEVPAHKFADYCVSRQEETSQTWTKSIMLCAGQHSKIIVPPIDLVVDV